MELKAGCKHCPIFLVAQIIIVCLLCVTNKRTTLEPLIKGHPWDQTFCPLNRGVPYSESQ